ncbi:MAG: hypothetical protein V2J55_09605, partial [Candidatus Competibacteraceae bacterium]|nr:hypothetical protein [Candidatus Competibacteraceae bacterium]
MLGIKLAQRIGQYLGRQGLLECDAENSYLAGIEGRHPSLTPNRNVRFQRVNFVLAQYLPLATVGRDLPVRKSKSSR